MSQNMFWTTTARRAQRLPVACLVVCLGLPAMAAILDLDEYLQRANASKRRGDWQSAASQYAQAVNHPDLPKAGAERSQVYLEYGRAVGALCQFAEAEKYLLLAKDAADKAGSPSFHPLYELGGVSVAQRKFADAVRYFAQIVPAPPGPSVGPASPLQFADVYEKFALALDATGKADEARQHRQAALALRNSNPKPAVAGSTIDYAARCPRS